VARGLSRATAYRIPREMTAKDSNETRILTRTSDFQTTATGPEIVPLERRETDQMSGYLSRTSGPRYHRLT
jgi:hypothetical protein